MPRAPAAICVAALVTLAGTMLGCRRAVAPAAKAPTAVRVRAVARAAAAAAARYSATIHPAARVDVAFKVGGYVEELARVKDVDGKLRPIQAGDHVTRGQELVSIRRTEYSQRLAEAKALLAEATAAREQAQLDHERVANLLQSGSVAQAQGDSARVQLDAANARIDGARARVAEAQTALADTGLRAPMDGVVLARHLEVGTLAGPGTVAFSVADTQTVKVVFGVPDTVLQTLQLGAAQAVSAEALRGGEVTGRITRIAPVADPNSRVFEVEVTLDNATDELKPGMVASLKLGERAAADAPVAVLPLTAIVRSPTHRDHYAVYVLDGANAKLREVELGEFLGNQIPIKTGLEDGEKVIVMGASLISDGEPVQVIP